MKIERKYIDRCYTLLFDIKVDCDEYEDNIDGWVQTDDLQEIIKQLAKISAKIQQFERDISI